MSHYGNGLPDVGAEWTFADRLAWEAGEVDNEPEFDEDGYPVIDGNSAYKYEEVITMHKYNVTEPAAREFWRDLMRTLGFNPNTKETHGIMSAGLVAQHMGISEDRANAFLWKCVKLGLSDRSCGSFVV